MPNYGFAIDLRKCIGCHACTIACKAEHDIPVGVNRCWVKTVEKGEFPETRRFFFPVLCNQCDAAPCVSICPTNALFKRRDGIVDLNGDSCIGCRACMEACPYDQLFIDPNTRTAEKCNFCANRIESRLEPACVTVCPTECRIFGDLDDPTSEVAQIVQREAVSVRKPEKGTKPKIFYLQADDSVIRPEIAARPFYFREGTVALRPIGSPDPMPDAPGHPRVDYDVPHAKPWGIDMVLYLLTKGIASGALLVSSLLWWLGYREPLTTIVGPAIAIVFITITAGLLIADLERPERFYYILTRSNWRSWLVRGAYLLAAFGVVATLWLAAGLFQQLGTGRAVPLLGNTGVEQILTWLVVPAVVLSILATSYTAFLFAQGLARDLWQGPHAAADLVAQAMSEGSAALLIAMLFVSHTPEVAGALGWMLFAGVAAHLALLAFEHMAPSPSVHFSLAASTFLRGTYARLFWGVAIVGGGLLPLALVVFSAAGGTTALLLGSAVLALAGGLAWEYIWVEAGQSVPLS